MTGLLMKDDFGVETIKKFFLPWDWKIYDLRGEKNAEGTRR